jgi:glutathione reductase (NADPH)
MADNKSFDYDLFVIGAGSGGVRAARISAGYGAKVAVAEEFRVGGTCVIRGCVPKKFLVYASRFADDFEDAAGYGWSLAKPTFSWEKLIANKDVEIARLEGIYNRTLANAGVEVIHSRAVLEGAHTVRLTADNRTVTAKNILIASGATPFVDHAVPGCELAITSNEALHLKTQPKHIVIVGGGYIAVEFAGIFHGLGSEVTLLYRGEEILRGFDDDLRKALHAEYERRGIKVRCGVTPARVDKSGDGVKITLSDGSVLTADALMAATGRVPNTAGLGLEQAGVALDQTGAVIVDGFSMSTMTGIHAVGDVTNRLNLTPVAIREGHAYADSVFGGKPTRVDHTDVPTAVFSTPEMGTVGLTEAAARKAHGELDIYKATFRPMKHTLSGRQERMLMKLIVDATTDRVLGVHILGPDAGEMAQLAGIAVKMGATKAQFDATVAVHPTAAEELVTMRTKWVGT